jgi:hypothetical protein
LAWGVEFCHVDKKGDGSSSAVPKGASRQCTLVIETQNLGTPDESLSPIIRVNCEIEDQVDDFPDGEIHIIPTKYDMNAICVLTTVMNHR